MAQENQDGGLISRYLLGRLQENELEQLEERMMVDSELFERVLLAEDEMIEAYVNGELAKSEVSDFKASFLSTPEGRQQVAYAEALRRHVKDVSTSPTVDDAAGSEDPGSRQRVVEAPLEKEKPAERPVADEPFLKSNVVYPQVWWRRRELDPYFKLAAAAVIVIGLAVGIWQILSPSDVSKGSKTLAYAYRDQRPVEARISGFNYAPAATTLGPYEKVDRAARTLAATLLLDAVIKHPDAETHHAAGRLFLADRKFDEAIEQFEAALKDRPNDATLQSDTGAALLERARDQEGSKGVPDLRNLAAALEHLDRALDLNPSLLDALFNRALCHEYSYLPKLAGQDWEEYLRRDSQSSWAEEARQHLEVLKQRHTGRTQSEEQLFQEFLHAHQTGDETQAAAIFNRSYGKAGNVITERLIGECLDFDSQGDAGSSTDRVELLSYAGHIGSSSASDKGTAHLAEFYKSTTRAQRATLTQARSLVKEAEAVSRETHYQDAIRLYRRSKKIFDDLGDHCEARYADYRIAHCRLRYGEASASLDTLLRLEKACTLDSHKWLLALIDGSIADAYGGLGEYSKALDYSDRALRMSEEIEDTRGIVRGYLQIAIGYEKVDDAQRSLANLEFAMMRSDFDADLSTQWIIYDVGAAIFQELNLCAAAVHYQKEAANLADEMGSPLNLSRSYAHLGLAYGRVGKLDDAIDAATRAYEIGRMLRDQRSGEELMAYASLYLGDLHRVRRNYAEALEYYRQNIDTYARVSFPFQRYAAHKGEFFCYLAQGDWPAAKAELATTLNLFEEYRLKILEESNRNTFFDVEQDIYDAAIDFEYAHAEDPSAAFEKSEASRARSLLDLSRKDVLVVNKRFGSELLASSSAEALDLSEILSALSPRAQIIEYAVLENKLLIWVLSQGKLSPAIPVSITKADLAGKVNRYVEQVSTPAASIEEPDASARELHNLLIKPAERFLDKEKYLCIVPDKELNRLPFSALVSDSGHYLVEDYDVGVCPSSAIFVRLTEAAREKEGKRTEKAIVVGNPNFDHKNFPSLQNLSSSARGTEDIAAIYGDLPITGGAAKEALLKREMKDSDVIHLSTHYVANPRSYLLSAFVLAQEPETESKAVAEDGQLQVREIYSLRLSRTRLAVLAACQTGVEKTYGGEGAISAARAFLVAGLPVVVASLWPVEADSTSKLMVKFHGHRRRDNRSTQEALCLAQREMINGDDARYRHPYYWASFAVIGGYSTY